MPSVHAILLNYKRRDNIVPIVRACDTEPLEALAAEVARLADSARAGTLKPEELRGGTFTVTSAGKLSGVVVTPGQTGSFEKGAGIFSSEEDDKGKKVVAVGVWDRITPTSCRWRQAVSHDAGVTWEQGWIMHWTRVGAARQALRAE